MNKDHIIHLPGFLDRVSCQSLIDIFESVDEYHEDGKAGGKVSYDIKKCTETQFNFLSSEDMILGYENFKFYPVPPITISKKMRVPVFRKDDFIDCLINGMEKYAQEYPFLDVIPQTRIFKTFKVQKYNPDECYFALHCESMGAKLDRVLAWMIYLNDVTEGGETEFPSQDKKFQPRCGDFLIWPAHFTHPHRGIASKTQVKYIVTGWTVYTKVYED